MRTFSLSVLFFYITISFANGQVVSGNVITKTLTLESFDTLEVSAKSNINIQQGGSYEISIVANEQIMDSLSWSTDNRKFLLTLKGKYKSYTLNIKITVPSIKSIIADNEAVITVGDWNSDELFLTSNSSSTIKTGILNIKKKVELMANVASKLTVKSLRTGTTLAVPNGTGFISVQKLVTDSFTVNSSQLGVFKANEIEADVAKIYAATLSKILLTNGQVNALYIKAYTKSTVIATVTASICDALAYGNSSCKLGDIRQSLKSSSAGMSSITYKSAAMVNGVKSTNSN